MVPPATIRTITSASTTLRIVSDCSVIVFGLYTVSPGFVKEPRYPASKQSSDFLNRTTQSARWHVLIGLSRIRRLKALRSVHDDGYEVPCYIRDADDETAKWIAIAENIDPGDLTPSEEAKIYADCVMVSHEGGEMGFDEYINQNPLLFIEISVAIEISPDPVG